MSSTSGNVQSQKAMAGIPGYNGEVPRFEGDQPIFIAARFVSSEQINWGYATFVTDYVGGVWEVDEDDDCPCHYDYDPEAMRSFLFEDIEREPYDYIKWLDRCGMEIGDWPHLLESSETKVDAAGTPVDNYWEICVINRDQDEFWNFLKTENSDDLGVGWMTIQQDPLKEVLNWVRDNPDEAQAWLTASPTPEELCGRDEALETLISKIHRAIRQGRVE